MEVLRFLTDDELMKNTKDSVARERELTTKILHQINEIESRRLHVKIGFSSLHECLVKYFHYSDGAAHRRISAARLLKRLPDAVAPALEQGQVNLTTIAAVQDFLVAEKKDFKRIYSIAETSQIITNIAGKSRTQCEQVFQRLSPQRALAPRPELTRTVQAQGLEIRFTADQALQTKLTRLREILSHHPDVMQSYAALIDTMATKLLKRIDPLAKSVTTTKMQSQCAATLQTMQPSKEGEVPQTFEKIAKPTSLQTAAHPQFDENPQSIAAEARHQPTQDQARRGRIAGASIDLASPKKLKLWKIFNRYIPATLRRQVYVRDQGRCCYVDRSGNFMTNLAINSKDYRCTARHYLHIDHVIPLALGGTTTLGNLRLLCAAHNQMEAVYKLGTRVMARHVSWL